jgi:hypothetical protein
MLDITGDIQSLTTFRRRSGDFMRQLRKTKRRLARAVSARPARARISVREIRFPSAPLVSQAPVRRSRPGSRLSGTLHPPGRSLE